MPRLGKVASQLTLKPGVCHWLSLPAERRDKTFWLALDDYLAPCMSPDFPLASQEFHNLPHSENITRESTLSDVIVDEANKLRDYYDSVSLWNPLALADHLGIAVSVVIGQLLLAKEHGLVSMFFVVVCRSCGCDILRVESMRDICFISTYHKKNIIRCPICMDDTEVMDLSNVSVFFQALSPPKFLQRKYHRLFYSEEAKKRHLESYFCPPDATFSFCMNLPQGRYLFILSDVGLVVELQVDYGAEYLQPNHPHYVVNLLVKKLLSECSAHADGSGGVWPRIRVDHGKLCFRLFNKTPYGGYVDVFVAFDLRLELLVPKLPVVTTVPFLLHHTPRGLRSPLLPLFIPTPPGTRVSGVYVSHAFCLPSQDFDGPISAGGDSVLAVIREVHRYSLEDHHGLLLSVGRGGTMFESSFLSVTAALASSLCLAQRVMTRLGEDVAVSLTCSITEGEMYMVSFQGQYDEDENAHSSYPDVQIVGPVVYAATHPPVVNADEGDRNTTQRVSRCARLELRSVSENGDGVCLNPSASDAMLPHFLSFIEDRLKGVRVVREPGALAVVVPLVTLNATMLLSSLLEPAMYTKKVSGPFG